MALHLCYKYSMHFVLIVIVVVVVVVVVIIIIIIIIIIIPFTFVNEENADMDFGNKLCNGNTSTAV